MAVSKTLRYQVFRRDNHTCRYCGRSAPEVKLTIDHVVPEALGGTDEPSNLVAACTDCNGGKSATPPDAAIVTDVASDALRWAGAIRNASAAMLADLKRREQDRQAFREAWDAWGVGEGKTRTSVPLPGDWGPNVDQFVSLGLPLAVLIDCIAIAMGRKGVKLDKVYSYMCGIAWNKVRQLQDAAAATAKTGHAEPDEEDHDCCPRCHEQGRESAVSDLISDLWQTYEELFKKARAASREELESGDPDRLHHWENNEVILTAHHFLDELSGAIGSRDIIINGFLKRIPAAMKEKAAEEALSDFYKAGEPYPTDWELAPHILRHVGRILAGGDG